MKVAVVGAGVSGLVAAHLLKGVHEITVFESERRVGGHAHTVDVEVAGHRIAVDTGFVVYNERTYPGLTKLFASLGVATQPSDMCFGVVCERSGIEWGSRSLGALLANPGNVLRPEVWRMLGDVGRFFRDARALLALHEPKLALGDWLHGAGYSAAFLDLFLVPLGAAIWSAEPSALLRFPAQSFVGFLANHGLLSLRGNLEWRTVSGGSRRYVEHLTAGFADRIRTGCPVHTVRRTPHGVELSAGGTVHRFDRVVLACHSNQALALLADASDLERRVLGAIRYQPNDALLHTDASLMPRARRAWASWNYRVPRDRRDAVLVTYHMNRIQRLAAPRDLFVTLNGADRVAPERVLARFSYAHPVQDAAAGEAQALHGQIDGRGGVHFAGAYWGFGFHEDGLASAHRACARLAGAR